MAFPDHIPTNSFNDGDAYGLIQQGAKLWRLKQHARTSYGKSTRQKQETVSVCVCEGCVFTPLKDIAMELWILKSMCYQTLLRDCEGFQSHI